MNMNQKIIKITTITTTAIIIAHFHSKGASTMSVLRINQTNQ